jgi:hypothetical protein
MGYVPARAEREPGMSTTPTPGTTPATKETAMTTSILTDDEKKAEREKKAAEWAALDALRVAADRHCYETFEERLAEGRAATVAATRMYEAHPRLIQENTAALVRIAEALEKLTAAK